MLSMKKYLLILLFIFTNIKIYAQTDGLNLAQSINSQGYMLLEEGNYSEAKKYFLIAISQDSTNLNFYLNLGRLSNETANWALGDSIFSLAKKVFPDNSDLFMYAGDVLQKLKKYNLAITDYTKAIILSDKNQDIEYRHLYFFNRGNAYLKLKKYKEAVVDYTTTIELFPVYFGAYANRGMAKYNLKDKKGACTDWAAASASGYKTADTYIKRYCDN